LSIGVGHIFVLLLTSVPLSLQLALVVLFSIRTLPPPSTEMVALPDNASMSVAQIATDSPDDAEHRGRAAGTVEPSVDVVTCRAPLTISRRCSTSP